MADHLNETQVEEIPGASTDGGSCIPSDGVTGGKTKPVTREFVDVCREESSKDIFQKRKSDEKTTAKAITKAMYDGFLVLYSDESKRETAKKMVEDDSSEEGTHTLFRALVKEKPYIAAELLDDCYKFKEGTDDKTIEFDYKYLEDQVEKCSEGNERKDRIHVLELLKDDAESDLLLHPVVASLLSWKWRHYIGLFYFANLSLYIAFLGFLTTFALLLPNPVHSFCDIIDSNTTETAILPSCGISERKQHFFLVAAIFIIGLSCLRLVMEIFRLLNVAKIFQIFSNTKHYEGTCCKAEYFVDPSNYLEIPLHCLSIVFALVYLNHCFCANVLQWQIGTVAVFLAWMDLILYLNKWPLLGVYIEMLWKIARRFFTVLLIAILLLLAFALAFYMTFYDPHHSDSPFRNIIVTFVTMISFAINGPDVSVIKLYNICEKDTDTLAIGEDTDDDIDSVPYPIIAHIIWIVFAAVVSFLFITFLVGLVVHDVTEMQKKAAKKRNILMINTFKQTEQIISYCNFVTRHCCNKRFLPACLDRRTPRNRKYNHECNSCYVKMAILWGDGIKGIITKAQRRKR